MFEAYSESEPDNAWGHYMLGLSAWKTGDHTRALEAFDAALRLDPTHRRACSTLRACCWRPAGRRTR